MSDKTAAIVVPGADQTTRIEERTIAPGSTAQDILNSLGLGTGWVLGKPDGTVFDGKDNVYGQIQDGDKLVVVPRADAGAGAISAPASILDKVKAILGVTNGEMTSSSFASSPRKVTHTKPLRIVHLEVLAVKPKPNPVWQEKGWTRVDNGTYCGFFEVPNRGKWNGEVQFGRSGFKAIYICDPPQVIRRHSKWTCFAHCGNGWYTVHMHKLPRNADEAILNVERILNEAYRL